MTGQTAVVYSEAFFGTPDGKTANGLVRHSEKYEILAVIDSTKNGLDAGAYLDERPNGIPICTDLDAAIALCGYVPDFFIIGVAPLSGMLSPTRARRRARRDEARHEHRQRPARVPERRPRVHRRGGYNTG